MQTVHRFNISMHAPLSAGYSRAIWLMELIEIQLYVITTPSLMEWVSSFGRTYHNRKISKCGHFNFLSQHDFGSAWKQTNWIFIEINEGKTTEHDGNTRPTMTIMKILNFVTFTIIFRWLCASIFRNLFKEKTTLKEENETQDRHRLSCWYGNPIRQVTIAVYSWI